MSVSGLGLWGGLFLKGILGRILALNGKEDRRQKDAMAAVLGLSVAFF